MASAKKMASQEDDDRSDVRHRAEEISTASHFDDHWHRAEERDGGHRYRNRNTAEASADRRHPAARSVREMRRPEDDPTDVHPVRIGFGKQEGVGREKGTLPPFLFLDAFFLYARNDETKKRTEFCSRNGRLRFRRADRTP